MKVLLVEDDDVIRHSTRDMLEVWGHVCDEADGGRSGWEMAEAAPYDLVILDLNLPGLDGLEVCRRIRTRIPEQPLILMLTARDTPHDLVVGLDQGADDYMVKPFHSDVLRARVTALQRRSARPLHSLLQWGALELASDGRTAHYGPCEIALTAKEHHILEALLKAAGRTCSKEQILNAVWSWETAPGDESIKTHIKNLGAKLTACGAPANLVETVYGIGFRMNPLHAT